MVQCGTVQVGDPFDPSAVRIDECDVTQPEAPTGGRTTAVLQMVNGNDQRATFDIKATVGGVTTLSEAHTISADDTTEITIRPKVPTTGDNYDVHADPINVGPFEGD